MLTSIDGLPQDGGGGGGGAPPSDFSFCNI